MTHDLAAACLYTWLAIWPNAAMLPGDSPTVDEEWLLRDVRRTSVAVRASKRWSRQTVRSHGAGVILSEDGYIATAAHVVHGFTSLDIELASGETLTAKLIARDRKIDLAILKASPKKPLPAAFVHGAKGKPGVDLVIGGNPVGKGQRLWRGTLGDARTVAWGDTTAELLSMTAPMISGHSGGGAYDLKTGSLVGIVVARSTGNSQTGYIVPTPRLNELLAARLAEPLDDSAALVKDELGLEVRPVTLQGGRFDRGLLVTRIDGGSPASMAGHREGDVLVGCGKYKTQCIDDLAYVVEHSIDEKESFVCYRDGDSFKGELAWRRSIRDGSNWLAETTSEAIPAPPSSLFVKDAAVVPVKFEMPDAGTVGRREAVASDKTLSPARQTSDAQGELRPAPLLPGSMRAN